MLNNYSMPLIRYKIGDIAKAIDSETNYCTCNRKMPQVKEITGRTTGMFVNKSGNIIDSAYFRSLLFYKDWILKYQIIQEDYSCIVFKIIKFSKYIPTQDELNKIKDNVRKIMGNNCKVQFDFKKHINPLKNGKYLYTINNINNQNA